KKDLIDAKNLAEQLIYTAEKALKDNAAAITEDIKNGVQTQIDAARKEKDSGTLETIKAATEALSTEMQKIGEAVNKAGAATPEAAPAEPTANTENV
ncbi:MAG: Hsp70 family protein, partial [Patescibacteria group bacterium]